MPGTWHSSRLHPAVWRNLIGTDTAKHCAALIRNVALVALLLSTLRAAAQDLAPRAYVLTPIHSNAITLTYGFYNGDLLFNGVVPITNSTGLYSVPVVSYYHSFNLARRTASFTIALPYGHGTFEGNVDGKPQSIYRSGALDLSFRVSVNLKGGPAMNVTEFRNWKQRTLIGVSLKVVPPTGQYDRTKLINWGSNRWAFRPEIGLSTRRSKWVVDAYTAVWFFTANNHFMENSETNVPQEQTQDPIAAFEGHLSYDVKLGLWLSLDGNFWLGGKTSLNGVQSPETLQRNSRIGFSTSIPIYKHNSLKFSYSKGAYIRYGGDYQSVSIAWQYSWIGKPKM